MLYDDGHGVLPVDLNLANAVIELAGRDEVVTAACQRVSHQWQLGREEPPVAAQPTTVNRHLADEKRPQTCRPQTKTRRRISRTN